MRRVLVQLGAAVAMALPLVASGDAAPQVVLATPGMGAGAIERFTVRFSDPIVPLGDPRRPAPFKAECPVGGAGRWVDQRTYVWDFARPLPGGARCTFQLNDGLTSTAGVAVGGQRRFVVDAGGPRARAVLPSRYGADIDEDQVFLVAANMAPDAASVAANAYCAVDGIGEKIPVDVLKPGVASAVIEGLGTERYQAADFLDTAGLPASLPKAAEDKARAFASVVALKCRRPLPPGRDVALVWGAGITAAGRRAGADQRFDFTVRKAFTARFECSRVNPQAGCSPVEKAWVRFTAPIPRASAEAIRLTLPGGKALAPVIDEKGAQQVSDIAFAAPLPAATAATVTLPAGLKDISGRPLANGQRFPLTVRFDEAPPLVKFAAPFGILEAREGGVLPVTVRNVEPALRGQRVGIAGAALRVGGSDAAVARWLRAVEKAGDIDIRQEKRGAETVAVNHTGATPLLTGTDRGQPFSVALPGKGKAFEVVGIPLAKPGFYVVELASPALGRALLGRNAPRYVAAGALVTNMAVHFKWGRAASLAWVTALDSGKPVAGADVRITDSCTGRTLATGRSDAAGRVLVKSGLPEPDNWGSCSENSTVHPLMVSARLGDDFSFTLSDWGKGIHPYDFDLPYGWQASRNILHTVFDRMLVRAGETIGMKHVLRRPTATGFAHAAPLSGTLRLIHRGSGTEFSLPLAIGADGIGESSWAVPKGAPQGDYDLSIVTGAGDKREVIYTGQSFRVDEFRLPTMRASVSGPKTAAVRPKSLPVDLYVGYLSGGGAAGLPVRLRTAFTESAAPPAGWEDWSFGGKAVREGTRPLDGDGNETGPSLPPAATLPLTLNAQGAARSSVDIPVAIDTATMMTVEMDYQDANGETLTASSRIPLYPSAVRVGIRTDGWLMKADDLRLRFVVLDTEGRPVKGRRVTVALYSREILTARRRLIGGFYAYDNQARTTKLPSGCTATTDAQGLARCTVEPGTSGEVYAVATTTDTDGNVVRAVRSVWLAGDDDWWFGGDNGDRMDLIPEAKEYKAGATARFQVRMPFRSATALVTVEREGVLSSFVTELSGRNPVVSVPMPAAYAPDVYVSVMAVRGRISGWRLWLADLARRWNLPWFSREGARPTALVDLAKPGYRLGIAKVKVGWEGHRLAVSVRTDKPAYGVRQTAMAEVSVRDPAGRPAAGAEIAFAAVDEALLQLAPNDSWNLLDVMMEERPLSVLTATAQTQVVGKRHYGRKTAEPGGGGGGDLSALTREDFRPLLLWKARVKLDAEGRARIPVPLSDSLSSFRFVAIATDGAQLFGTGSASVRTTQDLSVYPGVPPLVRSGDRFGATFTLRNGTDKPMTVTAKVALAPRIATGRPLSVTIPAGGAQAVTWMLTAPAGVDTLAWTVEAKAQDGKAADSVSVTQDVVPLHPVETWAAAIARVGEGGPIPVAAPAGAIAGLGSVDIRLSASLAPPLAGVRAYMAGYPYTCFEQQMARAVVLGDTAGWARLAGDLPSYQDSDGLLRYFPVDGLRGSEALTAHVLSLAAAAGFAIPEAPRGRMVEALRAVIDGRLRHEGDGAGDQRLLRVSALAALARQGAATPAMFGQIGIAPREMPTALLADWIAAVDAIPGLANRQALRAQAEAVLRTRLVYEGSRLDLVDQAQAPWWMMVGGDESAIKALIAVLGRPGWQDDGPKMMIGVAQRQQRGHWDTTPANAWGAIAVRTFARLYPATAVAGTTTLQLGDRQQTRAWPQRADAGALSFPLPARPTALTLAQAGGAGPWALVQVRAAVPLKAPLFAGYRIERSVTAIERRNPGRLTRGDVLRVRLTVEATAERNWVVVNDPVPPGATIIGGLGGQSALLADAADAAGEGVQPTYVERGRDAWRGYFAWVPRGRFTVEYAVRLNGVGDFALPPTRVEALYAPDIRGQLPNNGMTVTGK
ncbi:alpha-2-macroglobulin family protein [Sphingomonas flavalba]|uniref:alpha-2-macroglobulin family protein n=1 Tax=Sphingomonas flavalba TaxID=2559804 RepID=UPI00109DEB8F|nr:MG2 domain-containing protein [Sphingomonas flavalba]